MHLILGRFIVPEGFISQNGALKGDKNIRAKILSVNWVERKMCSIDICLLTHDIRPFSAMVALLVSVNTETKRSFAKLAPR